MSFQINFRYADDEAILIIHDSLRDIDKAIDTGIKFANTIKGKHSAKEYAREIDADIETLTETKAKMMLFKSEWKKNKEKRHLLTPILATITGLATEKSTQQLKNALMNLNMNEQKNQLITGILERNQKEIYQTVDKNLASIKAIEKSMNANMIEKHAYRFAMIAAEKFRKITQQTVKHYESIMRATENKMEIFNVLSASKLSEIENTLSDYAEVGDSIPKDTSVISLLKHADFDILITNDNQIMMTYVIPLVDKENYHIKHLHENQIILQNNIDGDTYTTMDYDMINIIHGNTVIITERPIIHFRKHNDWKIEINTAPKASLRDNTLLIADIPAGILQITCTNGSNSYRHSGKYTLAMRLEHSCSLVTPDFKIKATKHHSNINVRQELQFKSTISKANSTTLLLETNTTIMNLTKIPEELKTQNSPFMNTLTSKEWLSSVGLSLLITITPWLILFCYGFCKRSKT